MRLTLSAVYTYKPTKTSVTQTSSLPGFFLNYSSPMAPKGSSGGGKGFRGGGGGGGGGDDNGISAGEAVAIVVGIIGGPLLIWFIWAMIMDGLQKLRERIKRRATANAQMQEDTNAMELRQPQLPTQDPTEQRVATPERTYSRFDKMLHRGSLPKTYPTTPAYDTDEIYRPS